MSFAEEYFQDAVAHPHTCSGNFRPSEITQKIVISPAAGNCPEVTGNIVLAVTEACANIIRHCYGERSGERIDVEIRFRPGVFEVRIIDFGEFVDPTQMKGRELEDVKPGGLGLHFINTVMDDVEYTKNEWGGTTLILQKRIETTGGTPATGGGSGAVEFFDDEDGDGF